ncbi:MAG TPA: NADPH-dependent FMN reductase [Polyangiaceae bacterium]|nr:NADPH-dependent FMN reductase [Polyangiaceae bacterium]
MTQIKVSVLVGSLRQQSVTRKVARAFVGVAPSHLAFSFVEIGDLPLYNEELEAQAPVNWARFRNEVHSSDALLFFTPEFNRGIPGALKNAIDVGSRPWGKGVWAGKPAGVISQSYGGLGGMAAHHQLRQVLFGVGVAALPSPEAYIPNAGTLFDDQGNLNNPSTKEFATGFMKSFDAWVSQQRRQ